MKDFKVNLLKAVLDALNLIRNPRFDCNLFVWNHDLFEFLQLTLHFVDLLLHFFLLFLQFGKLKLHFNCFFHYLISFCAQLYTRVNVWLQQIPVLRLDFLIDVFHIFGFFLNSLKQLIAQFIQRVFFYWVKLHLSFTRIKSD